MLRSTAALLLRLSLAVALVPLNVCGVRLDRARLGHAGKGTRLLLPQPDNQPNQGRDPFVPKPTRRASGLPRCGLACGSVAGVVRHRLPLPPVIVTHLVTRIRSRQPLPS